MATAHDGLNGTESAILTRLMRPEQDNLPTEAAEALLRMHLDRFDLERLHELVTKNQDDALSAAEYGELESYLRISSFVDLMHAKARRSLRMHA